MKRILLLSLVISMLSCERNKSTENDILFNIRKYINVNKNMIGTPQNVDLNSIVIDSVNELPYYTYLESKIESSTKWIKTYRDLLSNPNGNRTQNLRLLIYEQNVLDSIQNIYSTTSKEDVYYEIYTTIKKTIPDTIPKFIIQDGKSKHIDSVMWYDETLFLANDKFEIFATPFYLDEELKEEID